jgi:hypothetical protein
MNSELISPILAKSSITWRPTPRLRYLAIGVALGCVFAATYTYGRTALKGAARADAVAIESENRAFCTELGLPPQFDAYSKCALGLAEVRRHTEERAGARAAGML